MEIALLASVIINPSPIECIYHKNFGQSRRGAAHPVAAAGMTGQAA